MSDSRNLKTREELEVQPGPMDNSSFFRVKADNQYYWMRLADKKKASRKNIVYYKALNLTVLSTPILTCYENKATAMYLKIEIGFLHKLFGQSLKGSYFVNDIVREFKDKQKKYINNLESSLHKEVCPTSQEVIPNDPLNLDPQTGALTSVFSRIAGNNKSYWMNTIYRKTHTTKRKFDLIFKTLSNSPIHSQGGLLYISISFLQQVFGSELKDSYSVSEISEKLKELGQYIDKTRTIEFSQTLDYEQNLGANPATDEIIGSTLDNYFAQVGTQENSEEVMLPASTPASTEDGSGDLCLDPGAMGGEQLNAYFARLEYHIQQNLGETAMTSEEPQDETLRLQYSVEVISEGLNGPAPEGTQENKIQDKKGTLSANPNTLFDSNKKVLLSQEQPEDSLSQEQLDVEFDKFIKQLEREERKRPTMISSNLSDNQKEDTQQEIKRRKTTRFDI